MFSSNPVLVFLNAFTTLATLLLALKQESKSLASLGILLTCYVIELFYGDDDCFLGELLEEEFDIGMIERSLLGFCEIFKFFMR